MVRIAVVGLGKMGLSHLAMLNAHPDVQVKAVCDASRYIPHMLEKYTGLSAYSDFDEMLREVELDAVVIATPSSLHASMVRSALRNGKHVFCEKPFCLDPEEALELMELAADKRLVNQVGYHNRFVGSFQEVKRLLDVGAIGKASHMLAEAYGPVVLRQKNTTWRTQRPSGGGCLYDYAAHPINLINWYLGAPIGVGGTVLNSVFSSETDDEAFGTFYFPEHRSAQLSVSWSDESYRKMTTKITIWGEHGRIYADRQECQVFLRDTARVPTGYSQGWNVRYTTELTKPVWFYVRGEEYSAQLEYFIRCIEKGEASQNVNSFAEAAETDRVIALMIADAKRGPSTNVLNAAGEKKHRSRWNFLG